MNTLRTEKAAMDTFDMGRFDAGRSMKIADLIKKQKFIILACLNKIKTFKLYGPFFPFSGWGSTISTLQSYYEEILYFLPLSSQEVLVLI